MKREILLIVAVLAALAACGKAPQVEESARAPGYQSDAWPDQLRERTLRQDESRRVYQ